MERMSWDVTGLLVLILLFEARPSPWDTYPSEVCRSMANTEPFYPTKAQTDEPLKTSEAFFYEAWATPRSEYENGD